MKSLFFWAERLRGLEDYFVADAGIPVDGRMSLADSRLTEWWTDYSDHGG